MGWLIFAVVVIIYLIWVNSYENNKTTKPNGSNRYKAPMSPATIHRNSVKSIQHGTANEIDRSWDIPIDGIGLEPGGKWDQTREKVFRRDKNKCVMCGSSHNLTVDHIKELSLGGSNSLSNLRTLCADCHEERHHRKFLRGRRFDADNNYGENHRVSSKIKAINEALKSGEGIGIKYIDRQGLYSERVIYPKLLGRGFEHKGTVYRPKDAYVRAYCELDKDERIFKVSRMRLRNTRYNFYDNETNSYTGTWDN